MQGIALSVLAEFSASGPQSELACDAGDANDAILRGLAGRRLGLVEMQRIMNVREVDTHFAARILERRC